MNEDRNVEFEATDRKSNVEPENSEVSFLYLSEEDMVDAGVLNAARCVDVMEEALGLMEDGDFIMGGPYNDAHGLMLYFPKKSPIENFSATLNFLIFLSAILSLCFGIASKVS